MRVTYVRVRPENNSAHIELSFKDPSRRFPYNVKAIYGLDADNLSPHRYGYSSAQNYHNLHLGERDIILRIDLNPNYKNNQTVSDLRDNLYRMIASSRTGIIEVIFGNESGNVAKISGFMTKFESGQFTETPEVQLTISCIDPMLRGLNAVDLDVSGLDPSMTVINDAISTAPHGFSFAVSLNNATNVITIKDGLNDEWEFSLDKTATAGFAENDVVYISSERNNKYAYVDVQNSGLITHLGDIILGGSIWPILFPGENLFAWENPEDIQWEQVSFTPTYWGV